MKALKITKSLWFVASLAIISYCIVLITCRASSTLYVELNCALTGALDLRVLNDDRLSLEALLWLVLTKHHKMVNLIVAAISLQTTYRRSLTRCT